MIPSSFPSPPPEARATRHLPFVDGLRAVAVLGIVAFHVRLPGAGAGFVGVDVFFVISGFLILGLLARDLERGQFSAIEFAARRALRILPPLFVVIAATLAVGLVGNLTPEDWTELAGSARAAAVFLANVYFQRKVDYFDTEAEEKPLLHLWSLSVEEQFYLAAAVAALGAAALARRSGHAPARLFAGMGLAALAASFALFCAGSLLPDGVAFYLTPFRAWQFLAGGVAAYVVRSGRPVPRAVTWAGAAMLVLAFGSLLEPMAATVPATLGAALLLAGSARCPGSAPARLLAARPMRVIGLLSYSWYLWHWPALFVMRAENYGRLDLGRDAAAALIALGLAALTYLAVERPLRPIRARRLSLRGYSLALGAAAAGTVALVAGATLFEALRPREDATLIANQTSRPEMPLETRRSYWSVSTLPDRAPKVLAVGDSFGGSLAGGVLKASSDLGVGIRLLHNGGCIPLLSAENGKARRKIAARCAALRADARATVSAGGLKGVILTGYWPTYLGTGRRAIVAHNGDRRAAALAALRADFVFYAAHRVRVLVIGPTPIFDVSAAPCAYRTRGLDAAAADGVCGKSREAAERGVGEAAGLLEEAARGLPHVRVIDPMGVFCDAAWCSPLEGASSSFSDDHHLNLRGSLRLYDAFKSDFAWVAGAG